MLDSRSLEVISRFKSAVLTKVHESDNSPTVASSNRGKKLPPTRNKTNPYKSKVVEYDGSNRLILTNEVIERSNYRNKRSWSRYYGAENGGIAPSDTSSSDSENETACASDEMESDGNPFKRLKISEILSPLGHPSEIATHPAISRTFKSTCLLRIASDLIDLIEVEQNTLNHLNRLVRVLNGEDWFHILEEHLGLPEYDHGLDEQGTKNRDEAAEDSGQNGSPNKSLEDLSASSATSDRETLYQDPFFALPNCLVSYEEKQSRQLEDLADTDADSLESVQQDLINYLQLSIQRQQEYIKNLTSIRNGIVKADRYRSDLHRWGREMSERKN